MSTTVQLLSKKIINCSNCFDITQVWRPSSSSACLCALCWWVELQPPTCPSGWAFPESINHCSTGRDSLSQQGCCTSLKLHPLFVLLHKQTRVTRHSHSSTHYWHNWCPSYLHTLVRCVISFEWDPGMKTKEQTGFYSLFQLSASSRIRLLLIYTYIRDLNVYRHV